ncbi:unnamed protein product [Miscanthus lutarioriparius]|uniref:Phytocyanin domain-containing protein n=1 Tax=Miscanthus lutarioriparius TaxID=422564 RepID=A0A811NVG8_9POAL|nr:unnamed protein product [Miscanthus lutarioriparius]CAD6231864.1 unnamed protein product [Miscanthus lutarioriparius]
MVLLSSGGRCGQMIVPCLTAAAVVAALAVTAPRGADAYKNYTVGDDKGWYDGLTLPGVDYQAWADGKNFSLGDFLIFNTDKNHSVVQTQNGTLYKSCDYNDSGPDDTVEWSAAAPEFSKDAVTVAVPLLKEGRAYFFSGNYDGEQCESGQHFAIDVAHGQGLPPDLRPPVAADAPAPSSAGAGPAADGAAALDFSHPKNVTTPSATDDDDGEQSGGSATTTSGSSTARRTLASQLRSALAVTVTMLITLLFTM